MQNKPFSLFVAGWRPFIGWVGGISILYEFVLRPIFNAILGVFGYPPLFLSVDSRVLEDLIFGLLGLGISRSWDKKNNADTRSIDRVL